MQDCLFCKIIKGEIPSTKVYEDELCYAFRDIQPAAPCHILIVPREHIASANELKDENKELIGHIMLVAAKLANELGYGKSGYRVLNNCGKDAGQTVFHLHFHLLAGETFKNLV